MKKVVLTLIITGMFLTGCADMLTKSLKTYNYAPIVPIPTIQHVGDIYRTKDLTKPPVILMRDVFTSEKMTEFMDKLKVPSQLPSVSSESKFDLSLKADVIGQVKAELNSHNVNKFKMKMGGVNQYIISEDKFETEFYPLIKAQRPEKNFVGNYVILGLLQATTLEYELLNEKGVKVDVEPGGEIEKIVKAKLGAEWKSNANKNLTIDKPSFVGYRIGKLNDRGFDAKAVMPISLIFSPLSTEEKGGYRPIKIQNISTRDLRKNLKSDLDK